ncbi:MAG: hypothetical protein WBP16_01055 [Ferruginibacter sp.]
MVRFKKKFLFFKVSELWFGYRYSFSDLIGLTAYLHVGEPRKKIYGVLTHSSTVENSLEEPEEIIFSNFSKTVKVEIKQAEKKNIDCVFKNDFAGFAEFYNDFAKSRKIDLVSMRRLHEMNGNIKLSFAVSGNIKVAAHSYLVDEEQGIARLMHSASLRLHDEFDRQLSGKVNKLLHYRDMLYFKAKGFKIYDFGGYAANTSDKGLQGINKFKLSFGGEKKICNNYSSYSYFLLKKIAAVFGLLGRG